MPRPRRRTALVGWLVVVAIGSGVGVGCAIHGKVTEGPRAASAAPLPTPLASGPPPTGVNYMRPDMPPDPCAPPCMGECTQPITTGVMLPNPRVDPGGRCLETIAARQNTPRPLAVVGADVYWGNWDSVGHASIHGGAVVQIAMDQKRPTAIALGGPNIFWTNPARADSGSFKKTDPDYGGTVAMVPLGGGRPVVLARDQAEPEAIAVDETSVYWTNLSLKDPDAGAVMKVPLLGGPRTVLASGQNMPRGLAVHGKFVFWTANDKLKRVSVDGGAVVVVSPADENVSGDIALDANNIYCFATKRQQMTAAEQMRGETPGARLLKVPLDGSPVTVLATDLSLAHGITIDGSSVYWIESGLMKVPLDGGKVETIGGEKETISSIAVDATSVYWTSFDGTVKRLTPK